MQRRSKVAKPSSARAAAGVLFGSGPGDGEGINTNFGNAEVLSNNPKVTAAASHTDKKSKSSEMSFTDFSQNVKTKVKLYNHLQLRQQLIFAVPLMFLLALLSHLTRFDKLYKISRRQLANLDLTDLGGRKQLPFQVPTEFTVRNYYNNREQEEVITELLRDYKMFHAEQIMTDAESGERVVKPNTPYLLYRWCHEAEEGYLGILEEPVQLFRELVLGVQQKRTKKLSACHSPDDVTKNLDGLMTAIYVAMMTDRHLIVEDIKEPTGLTAALDLRMAVGVPHELPKKKSKKEEETEEEESEVGIVETTKHIEDMCYALEGEMPVGVEIVSKEWLGEELWKTPCFQKYLKRSSDSKSVDILSDTKHAKELYQWGFWNLFKVNKAVLDQADAIRKQAGLPQNNKPVIMTTSTSALPVLRTGKSARFAPYYYGATTAESHQPLNKGIKALTGSKLEGEDRQVIQCAQNLYKASVPLSNAVEGATNEEKQFANPRLHRSLFLEGTQMAQWVDPHAINEAHWPHGTRIRTKFSKERSKNPFKRLSALHRKPWYRDFWADVVIAIESECLIMPEMEAETGAETGAGALAQRVSFTRPETKKRCYVESGNWCQNNIYLEKHLLERLPWTDELSTAEEEEE